MFGIAAGWRKVLAPLVVVCVVCGGTAVAAQEALVTTIVGTFLAGRKVSDIIGQFKQTGSQLLDQANSSGNAFISRGSNEANVLAQNLSFILRDRMNDAFEKLDDSQRKLLIESEKIRIDLDKIIPGAYEIKDTLVLDLAALASELPFVQRTFFVQAVQGLAQMPSNGDFRIRVLGSTLGQQEGLRTAIRFALNGHDVTLSGVDQSQHRGVAELTIPNAALAASFKDRELAIVPAVIFFDVEKDRTWWRGGGASKETFSVPISLALYPPIAGEISVTAKQAQFAWKPISQMSRSLDTPDRHCDKHCQGQPTRGPNQIEFAVKGGPPPFQEGYQRLLNPQLTCSGPSCAFSWQYPVTVTDDAQRVYAHFDTWSHPSHWTLTADVEKWAVDHVKDFMTSPKPIGYDRLYKETLPTDLKSVVLTVKTFTGRTYEMDLNKPDPNRIVEYQSLTALGDGTSMLIYRALPPPRIEQ